LGFVRQGVPLFETSTIACAAGRGLPALPFAGMDGDALKDPDAPVFIVFNKLHNPKIDDE